VSKLVISSIVMLYFIRIMPHMSGQRLSLNLGPCRVDEVHDTSDH